MTYILKCDNCGKTQESPDQLNPINPATGERWYSRVKDGKVQHACSRICRNEIGIAPVFLGD